MPEVIELRADDIDPPLARAWDALPAARGTQADIYDSHAWFSAWLSAAPKSTADKIRIPAVTHGGRPISILALVLSGGGRRAGVVGVNSRTRARPVVGSDQRQRDTLGPLAGQVTPGRMAKGWGTTDEWVADRTQSRWTYWHRPTAGRRSRPGDRSYRPGSGAAGPDGNPRLGARRKGVGARCPVARRIVVVASVLASH